MEFSIIHTALKKTAIEFLWRNK